MRPPSCAAGALPISHRALTSLTLCFVNANLNAALVPSLFDHFLGYFYPGPHRPPTPHVVLTKLLRHTEVLPYRFQSSDSSLSVESGTMETSVCLSVDDASAATEDSCPSSPTSSSPPMHDVVRFGLYVKNHKPNLDESEDDETPLVKPHTSHIEHDQDDTDDLEDDSDAEGFLSDETQSLPITERTAGLRLAHTSSSSHSAHRSSNGSSSSRPGFYLDLTALTAAKPLARVSSISEIPTASYHLSTSDHITENSANDDKRHIQTYLMKSTSAIQVSSSSLSRPTSASAPALTFQQAQASLSRRLLDRPSVDSLVQHNILFGPDMSPSLTAAARAFKWRRNSDELNHRLARRASRDSLIQHNIIHVEGFAQRQQRFKQSQTNLETTLGHRSSVESLVQRNILQVGDTPSSTSLSPLPSPTSSQTSHTSTSPTCTNHMSCGPK